MLSAVVSSPAYSLGMGSQSQGSPTICLATFLATAVFVFHTLGSCSTEVAGPCSWAYCCYPWMALRGGHLILCAVLRAAPWEAARGLPACSRACWLAGVGAGVLGPAWGLAQAVLRRDSVTEEP